MRVSEKGGTFVGQNCRNCKTHSSSRATRANMIVPLKLARQPQPKVLEFICRDYAAQIGGMEKNIETTIYGVGFRDSTI